LAEPSQFQLAGVRNSVFWTCKTGKKIFSTERNDLKKTPWNCQEKEQKKIEMCRNITFDALCIKEVIHKCQRRHARFPVGRVYPRFIESGNGTSGDDFVNHCQPKSPQDILL
jgi:hypothetical protein